ncbi:unnamed protein product [Schistosoma margrebowiei]|uniref:Uncharacterized protein n=1 Tax=Schistosoma margrebowiei TaxID=48269 RepID=A0A3P7XXA5_9TREM|nr:unnamed protein product [Schistosoma margrebowiei]
MISNSPELWYEYTDRGAEEDRQYCVLLSRLCLSLEKERLRRRCNRLSAPDLSLPFDGS